MGSISKDACSYCRTNFLEDVPTELLKEYAKKKFNGNYRSEDELQFKSKKTEEGFHLFLNVCGCCATEVEVKVIGSFVLVTGEGKAFSNVKRIKKGINMPEDVKFDPTKVKGYLQKGQLQIFFPSMDEEIDFDQTRWHKVECIDLPWNEKKGVCKVETESETEIDELEISIVSAFLARLSTAGVVAFGKKGIHEWFKTPRELDFETEFIEKGFHVFLNVSGCAAEELKVTVIQRVVSVIGDGAALSGPVTVRMSKRFPENFKFDPDKVSGFVLKGELHVLFPYTKEVIDLEQRERYTVPSINLP